VHPVVGRPYQDGKDARSDEYLGNVEPTHRANLRSDYNPIGWEVFIV
jgi:hypothetical protein